MTKPFKMTPQTVKEGRQPGKIGPVETWCDVITQKGGARKPFFQIQTLRFHFKEATVCQFPRFLLKN